jgi:hypothetical protein
MKSTTVLWVATPSEEGITEARNQQKEMAAWAWLYLTLKLDATCLFVMSGCLRSTKRYNLEGCVCISHPHRLLLTSCTLPLSFSIIWPFPQPAACKQPPRLSQLPL